MNNLMHLPLIALLIALLPGCAGVEPIVCETETVEVTRWRLVQPPASLLQDYGKPELIDSTNGALHRYALEADRIIDMHVCDKKVISGVYDAFAQCLADQ